MGAKKRLRKNDLVNKENDTNGKRVNLNEGFSEKKKKLDEIIEEAKTLPLTRSKWKISDAIEHLVNVEPLFEKIVTEFGIPNNFKQSEEMQPPFHVLFKTICNQQLAASAAKVIFQRCLEAFGVKEDGYVSVEDVIKAKVETVFVEGKKKQIVNGKVCGLSESKLKSIESLKEHFSDPNKLKEIDWFNLSDKEL